MITLPTQTKFALTLFLPLVLWVGAAAAHQVHAAGVLPRFESSSQLSTLNSYASSSLKGEVLGSEVSRDNVAELESLLRPAIVRIMTYWEGTSTISGFMFDPNTGKWQADPRVKKPIETPYIFTSGGTGFVVSSDGYIVSNSHVVSTGNYKRTVAEDIYFDYIFSAFYDYGSPIYEWYKGLTIDQKKKILEAGLDYIVAHSTYNTSPKIAIVQPMAGQATTTSVTDLLSTRYALAKKNIQNLIASGTPISVVYVNDKYKDDEEDYAIMKVNLTNLPYIHLGSSASTSINQVVYHYGYPGSADISGYSGDPTLTRGTINAYKNSVQNTFKYIQTDAKLSSGSSGSPLLSEQGMALGIVTIASGGLFSLGDGFGFAFPIDRIKKTLTTQVTIPSVENDYFTLVVKGLALKEQKHCRAAIASFTQAQQKNMAFGDTRSKLGELITSCNEMIQDGASLDTSFDYLRNWINSKGEWFWIATGTVAVVAVVVVYAMIFLLARLKRQEKVLQMLEHATPQPAPTVEPEKPIQTFITQNRLAGESDQEIISMLVASGWRVEDATAAVSSVKR